MSTEMQTKVQASPAQSFTPAQTGLLQRKSALCNTPGLVEDSGRDKEKLTLQRSSVYQAGINAVPRFGHDFSRVSVHSTGPGMIQTKLKINKPGDPYEQEADRVADAVMRMEEPRVQRHSEEELVQKKPLISPLIQIQTEGEEGEVEDFIQTKELPGQSPEVTPSLSSSIQSLRGGGQPLPESTRAYFEPRFGRDFSQVRVHADSRAAEVARVVNAQAFTVGRDMVFGSGQYSPETSGGKQLMAHELTHVVQQGNVSETIPQLRGSGTVLQRQNGGTSPANRAYPYSVTTTGCNEAPYTESIIEQAAKKVFEKVKNSNCIKTVSLKERILKEFNGLNINCKQDNSKFCGWAKYYFSQSINLYPISLDISKCNSLESTILHEVIHLTQWALWHHDLPTACEKSCFNVGPGDASKCTFEKSWVPAAGASAGIATPSKGGSAMYTRLYVGLEKRGPVLSFICPFAGIGVGLIGETTTGEPGAIPSGTSTLVSLIGGLRLDPGMPGGGHLSFFGGPAVDFSEKAIGAEAGVALGYRWRWLDFSVDAGYTYDPTREAGMDELFTLGVSVKIGPSVPRDK